MLLQKQKIQDLQATVTFLRNRVKTITDEINSLRNKSGKTGGSETTITVSLFLGKFSVLLIVFFSVLWFSR